MNKVIIITYTGNKPSQEVVNKINDALNAYMVEGTESTFNVIEDQSSIANETNDLQINIEFDPSAHKLKVLKALKETLRLDLKTAKDMVDNHIVIIPNDKSLLHKVCSMISPLGAHVTGYINNTDPLANAALFLNAHFNNHWDMVSEAACAYKAENPTRDQAALLSAINIVANSNVEECDRYGISSLTYNACYNIKYHILNID